MTPQSSTIFCGVSSILVVLVMKALVTLHRVSSYLIWPFKVWLILNPFQDLMHWFLEYHANHLSCNRPKLPSKVSSGPIIVISIRLEILLILRDNLSLPFPLLLVFLDPLILVNMVHEPTHTPYNFLVNDFLKSCLAGRLTFKILMATSSKSPSISLYISQYLSEYVFRVSLSHMVIDNRESKGQGTLLQVINRAPNALVSSLKELIEPFFRP